MSALGAHLVGSQGEGGDPGTVIHEFFDTVRQDCRRMVVRNTTDCDGEIGGSDEVEAETTREFEVRVDGIANRLPQPLSQALRALAGVSTPVQ